MVLSTLLFQVLSVREELTGWETAKNGKNLQHVSTVSLNPSLTTTVRLQPHVSLVQRSVSPSKNHVRAQNRWAKASSLDAQSSVCAAPRTSGRG